MVLKKKSPLGKRHLFQNVQNEICEIWKMFKSNMKFTPAATQKLATEKTMPHSSYSYVVTIVRYYYAVNNEGL